jgi:mRNA-degrading endonuclease YafQ of YafQ-DinJ toxin-antitoxin module
VYSFFYTPQFEKATKKVDRRALEQACAEILADPYHARGSHRLMYDWAGFRAAEFKGPYRIIFRICEECVQQRDHALHPLGCCEDDQRDVTRVTFLDFGDYHSQRRRRLRPKRYTIDP